MRPSPATEIGRRAFLRGAGLGVVALRSMLAASGSVSPLHHAPKARRVIFL
jgi:hypothetical protein